MRCRSETAKVWFLGKRYIHLLTKYRHVLEDIARSAAAASVVAMLGDKYPNQHLAHPFTPVDWLQPRLNAVERGQDLLMALELHYSL